MSEPAKKTTLTLLALAAIQLALQAAPSVLEISPERRQPCNIAPAGEEFAVEVALKAKPLAAPAKGGLRVTAKDFFGAEAASAAVDFELKPGSPCKASAKLGKLEPGYYELDFSAKAESADGQLFEGSCKTTAGVASFIDRSAKEARAEGSRFGLKLWTMGPMKWKGRTIDWNEAECLDACARTGLQWTRVQFNQKSQIDAVELLKAGRLNAVVKIDGIPELAYDSVRFGPKESFQAKYGKRSSWSKGTLPLEEPYKNWLREQLKGIPAEQDVFELWNEPFTWAKTMPGEDFAKLCSWILEVLKESHPNAVVGPNCGTSLSAFDKAFRKAGGFDGMKMVAIHPYTGGRPEIKNFRQRLRNERELLKMETGRDFDFYATEYGWTTTPERKPGEADWKAGVSEAQQAQRTVRESLMLYAEDVKTLIPHWMADREQDPQDREHWFGFFHPNNEPKPVFLAHAVCAKTIDSSRFAGDLWLGTGVGAELFERKGALTLALWTCDEERELELDVMAPELTVCDMMGRERKVETNKGRIKLTIDGNPKYLVGVGRGLLEKASKPGSPLRPDQWGELRRPGVYQAPLVRPFDPEPDAEPWNEALTIELKDPKRSATLKFAWDGRSLYVQAKSMDKNVVNANPPEKALNGDSFELRICSKPETQVDALYDFSIVMAPSDADGKPAFVFRNPLKAPLTNPKDGDSSGIRWKLVKDAESWTATAAIPFEALYGMEAKAGERLSFNAIVYDRDRTDIDEWKTYRSRLELANAKGDSEDWPLLELSNGKAERK